MVLRNEGKKIISPERSTIHKVDIKHGRQLFGMFPKIGVPQNGCLIRKNPIEMDDLGVPLFLGNTHMGKIQQLPTMPSQLLNFDRLKLKLQLRRRPIGRGVGD